MSDTKVAQVSEIARYEDGTMIHCALARGHNNGLDEQGVNHKEIYETRRDNGELPFITDEINVTPVVEHTRDGVRIHSHWRSRAEDVERFINGDNGGEGKAHKLAKQACLELIDEGKIGRIVRTELPKGFSLGGRKDELKIVIGDMTYFADVGAWDARFPDAPVVFEVTNTSGQKAKRLKAMSDARIRVYEIVIGPKVRDAARKGIEINVQFFRNMILSSKFRLRNGASTDCALTEYIKVQEAKEQAERKRAFKQARDLLVSERNIHRRQDQIQSFKDDLDKMPDYQPQVQPVSPPDEGKIKDAIEYVRRVGHDVAANQICYKLLRLRGRDAYEFRNDTATDAAYEEIKKMSPVRAIHINNAAKLYGALLAHD